MVANQQSYKERPGTVFVAYLRVISTPVSIRHGSHLNFLIERMAEVKSRKWIQQRIDSLDPERLGKDLASISNIQGVTVFVGSGIYSDI